MSNTFTS